MTVLKLVLMASILAACSGQFAAVEPVQEVQYEQFDGKRAWLDVDYQVSLGARTPGSKAHTQTALWIEERLRGLNWAVETQEVPIAVGAETYSIKNITAKLGSGRPWLILGAHYDSRFHAEHDADPNLRTVAVPGGNDGASGVAVLLELGRVLPSYLLYPKADSELRAQQIWLVFFDAEDNGQIEGWDWCMGSRAFVENLEDKPDAAVIVDMIGDKQLEIFMEQNSDPQLSQEIWDTASALGFAEWFIPEEKYRILDDHIPFIEAGIPAVDVIDFDYPYWHTTADTADKVSPESLNVVGETLLHWLVCPLAQR